MLRAAAPYLMAAEAISMAPGASTARAAAACPHVAILLGCLIGRVGYPRWDEREHHHR